MITSDVIILYYYLPHELIKQAILDWKIARNIIPKI